MANAARHEPEAVAALRAGRDDRMNRLLRLPLPEPYVADPRRGAARPAAHAGRPSPAKRRSARRKPARKAARRREAGRPTPAQTPAVASAGHHGGGQRAAHGGRRQPATRAVAHWKVSVTGERLGHTAEPAGRSEATRGSVRRSISVVLAGGGTAGHVEPAMAVADALSRARSRGPDHRAGHRARPGDQAGARARLRPRADHARCRCRASPPATWSGCRRGCGGRSGRPVRCSTTSTPTWSSASAATSRCPPIWPPAAVARRRGAFRW